MKNKFKYAAKILSSVDGSVDERERRQQES